MPKADKRNLDPKTRSRTWLLTVANPKVDDVKDDPDISYCTWQIERGAPSENEPLGHRHMHVFVVFCYAKTLKRVLATFEYLGSPHCDPCDLHAYFYATKSPGQEGAWKEKDFTVEVPPKEIGLIPSSIKRNLQKGDGKQHKTSAKVNEIAQSLKDGTATLDDIHLEHPGWYMMNEKKVIDYDLSCRVSRVKDDVWKPWVVWLYGSTGTGKTSSVYRFEKEMFDNIPDQVHITGKTEAFVNGYFGNDAVLIDETRGEIPYKELLKLTDWNHGGCSVNMKGIRDAKWFPKRIYITSCYHPDNIYKGQMTREDRIDQLIRRLDYLERVSLNWDGTLRPITDWMKYHYIEFTKKYDQNKFTELHSTKLHIQNPSNFVQSCVKNCKKNSEDDFDLDLTDEERVKRCTMTDDQKFMELRSRTVTDSQLHEEEMIEQRHKASLINLKQMFEDESEV